jgi:1,4-dihydroxy-2-naphthoyl-CoA hydrolase
MTLAESLQKFHEGMFGSVLGIRFVDASPERIVAEMVVRDDMCTTPGVLHGGAIMAFADSIGATGTAVNLPQGAGTTTLESKTNFFAAGRIGETVRGESVPLHRGRRTMVWQTRVTNPDGRLLALVTQTQMVLEARQTEQETMASLFEGKSVVEQKALLATLERGGAAFYRALAAQESDAATKDELLAAAVKEEENAATLESQASVNQP